ncbi:putative glycoside hydrolase family 39 protein [Neofusicoccum parvum]|uniref:Glycoside hydrolase family 39 protein n=1 Tax=Neofusicoccum parvum TaxID=310453 RepID=A0ACB5SLL9_9PEZI|nr:putative glycoside hydrolase family 39 protein [Neofusicoccum parvum]GME60322.1 putative glycoside hydrolase family 39 protein [Neofusicoccum parvum]
MHAALVVALAGLCLAKPITDLELDKRATDTAVVNLANNTGNPSHYASGILYGIPDTANQIPDHFYTDIGFNYARAGGAQVASPGRGWIWNEYPARFASALSNYKTTRKHGGTFILLPHDVWGADGTQNSSAPYPGDNGDWKSYDAYLDRLISDLKANGMTTSTLVFDIWNEPDLSAFWNRNQDQYLQVWGRTYYKIRSALPNVLISGPSSSNSPTTNPTWWSAFLSFVATNGSVPDQWSWHMEYSSGNMLETNGNLQRLLNQYKLPRKPLNINEYAVFNEEVPAGAAWFIAQLERVDAHGLRGNWLSGGSNGGALHDYMASLLGKPNAGTSAYDPLAAGYWPNGEWQVYRYYNANMTGTRRGSTPSGDAKLDAYTTVGADGIVRTLVGVRITTGTWQLQIENLSSVGLPQSGTLNIHTWGFPDNGHYGEVDGPKDLGTVAHTYSGNSVTFPIYQTDATTAYAFEFAVGS